MFTSTYFCISYIDWPVPVSAARCTTHSISSKAFSQSLRNDSSFYKNELYLKSIDKVEKSFQDVFREFV